MNQSFSDFAEQAETCRGRGITPHLPVLGALWNSWCCTSDAVYWTICLLVQIQLNGPEAPKGMKWQWSPEVKHFKADLSPWGWGSPAHFLFIASSAQWEGIEWCQWLARHLHSSDTLLSRCQKTPFYGPIPSALFLWNTWRFHCQNYLYM